MSNVLDQPGFDVLIIHELAKYIKLLPQKLVCKIDLKKKDNMTVKGLVSLNTSQGI